jgi:hypothetical protein
MGYQLLLPLTMCKETSWTFSTCSKVKKVQEKSGSRRFWKYDAIEACIKPDSEPKRVIKEVNSQKKISEKLAKYRALWHVTVLCSAVLWVNKANYISLNLTVIQGLLQDNLLSEQNLLSPEENLLLTSKRCPCSYPHVTPVIFVMVRRPRSA